MQTLNKPQLILNNFHSSFSTQHLEKFFQSACLNANNLNIRTFSTPNFQIKIEFSSRQIMKNVLDKLEKLKSTGTQKFEIISLDANTDCQSKSVIGFDKNFLTKKTSSKPNSKFKILTLNQYLSRFPVENQTPNEKDYYHPKNYYQTKSTKKQTSNYGGYRSKSNYYYEDKYQDSYYDRRDRKSRQRSRPYKRSRSRSSKKMNSDNYHLKNPIKKEVYRPSNRQDQQKKTPTNLEERKLIELTPKIPIIKQEKLIQHIPERLPQITHEKVQIQVNIEEKEKTAITVEPEISNNGMEANNSVIENKLTSPTNLIEQKSPTIPLQIKNEKEKQRVAQLLKNKQLLNLLLRKSTTIPNPASKTELVQSVSKQVTQSSTPLKNTNAVGLSGSKKKKK